MRAILLPKQVKEALARGATLAISISGGKDSQALLKAVAQAHRKHGWTGKIFAVHSDLGRAEWKQTASHVEKICQEEGIELVVTRRSQGDLQDQMEARMEKLAGQNKPHFPSSAARYCTSDQKRSPIDKILRQYGDVVSAEGVRASESPARAKKPCSEPRSQIVTRERQALDWRPLLNWTDEDIWQALGTSKADLAARRDLYKQGQEEQALDGWQAHPAYVMGNERLSCAICVLASRNDIINGARHNPEYFQAIVNMEQASGFSFRKDLRLSDLFK